MKQYDFETVEPRYDVCAGKWSEIEEYFPDRPKDIIPFSVADMELPIAPEISEGLIEYIKKYPLGYANVTPEFNDSIQAWIDRRHNWSISTEWIVPVRGVIPGFKLAVQAYTKVNEGVILMTPVYYPMYSAIEGNNRKIVACPLINKQYQYEIDFDLLEKLAKDDNNTMLLFCSPHNPGGRVWTKDELARVAEICIENNVLICSDEVHFDLTAPGVTHHIFASLSEEVANHSVILTAPSKSFNVAGLESAYAIIPNEILRDQFIEANLKVFNSNRVVSLGFEATRLAYTEGEAWFDQVKQLIDKNHKIVIEFFEKEIPTIKCMDLQGTYLLWMDFSGLGIEDEVLTPLLKKEAKLFFDDGLMFGEEGRGYQRWNLAAPTKYIEEALLRLKDTITKL
ncbi:MalY/PatB family protein [Fundicoccus culcitae]|uniref:cysteine-S-conjugate beta-lyase n=1 Tax=Fundicoccus culcitae TaxID=2969821 RepID=A0ABY5P5P3_9LACT|nr:MalY/PatB family protein [Fundicoccus culcitae]UUX34059.1 pyridoxal phosphate-dependent aminotransferase [Fundicoccus culcitae]